MYNFFNIYIFLFIYCKSEVSNQDQKSVKRTKTSTKRDFRTSLWIF